MWCHVCEKRKTLKGWTICKVCRDVLKKEEKTGCRLGETQKESKKKYVPSHIKEARLLAEDEKRSVVIQVTVTPAMQKEIKALAKLQSRTPSTIGYIAFGAYLRDHGRGSH